MKLCLQPSAPATSIGAGAQRGGASGTAQVGLCKWDCASGTVQVGLCKWDCASGTGTAVSIVIGGKLGRRTGVATRRCHAGSDPRSWSPHPCLGNQPHRLSALGLTGIASARSAEPGLTLRARLNRDRRGRARALMAACPILYMAWARGAGAWTGPCTRERQVREAPSAGADVAGVSPVPVQMWTRVRTRCAQTRADVAGVSPASVQDEFRRTGEVAEAPGAGGGAFTVFEVIDVAVILLQRVADLVLEVVDSLEFGEERQNVLRRHRG